MGNKYILESITAVRLELKAAYESGASQATCIEIFRRLSNLYSLLEVNSLITVIDLSANIPTKLAA